MSCHNITNNDSIVNNCIMKEMIRDTLVARRSYLVSRAFSRPNEIRFTFHDIRFTLSPVPYTLLKLFLKNIFKLESGIFLNFRRS